MQENTYKQIPLYNDNYHTVVLKVCIHAGNLPLCDRSHLCSTVLNLNPFVFCLTGIYLSNYNCWGHIRELRRDFTEAPAGFQTLSPALSATG